MKKSCGIIILNENNEILLGHVTGQKHNDIPKGMLEDNEKEIDCAIRECSEETSLVFEKESLIELGEYSYLKDKLLHLFLVNVKKSDIDLTKLKCESYFEHYYTKKQMPEVDGFNWFDLNGVENHLAKTMGGLLKKINGSISQNKKLKL